MNELETILGEITNVLQQIPPAEVGELAVQLLKSKRIFVVGEGRSGLMGKSFAMRLMHLGATVYVIGETITPAMGTEDTLVAISGSGTTESVNFIAEKARKLNCQVIAVTTDSMARLTELATRTFLIPAATKYRKQGETQSIQPLSSLFDQSLHLFLDAVCLRFAEESKQSHSSVLARHSNLES